MITAFGSLGVIAVINSRWEQILKEWSITGLSIAIIIICSILALITFYVILRLKETINKLVISDSKIEELDNELKRLKGNDNTK